VGAAGLSTTTNVRFQVRHSGSKVGCGSASAGSPALTDIGHAVLSGRSAIRNRQIKASGVGEYDGHEIAVDGSDGVLYMYGPDADLLFGKVAPVPRSAAFVAGAQATKRYGPPGDGVRKVTGVAPHCGTRGRALSADPWSDIHLHGARSGRL